MHARKGPIQISWAAIQGSHTQKIDRRPSHFWTRPIVTNVTSLGGSVSKLILIADNSAVWRAGLSAILGTFFPDHRIIQADNLGAVYRNAESVAPPALITIAPTLSGMEGSRTISNLRGKFPNQAFAIVGTFPDHSQIFALLRAGANGAIPRDLPEDELRIAFQTVLSRHIYVPNSIATAHRAPAAVEPEPSNDAPPPPLTHRQKEVLSMLVTGQSNKEIARTLSISENTVKVHLAAAFRQLGVNNRVRAISVFQSRSARHNPEVDIIRREVGVNAETNQRINRAS